MCNCINITVQSYGNQVKLIAPEWSSKEFICVDKCLEKEIKNLWRVGVITTGCCCGHNYMPSYIGVDPGSTFKMKSLGYIPINITKNGTEFGPKTVY